MSLAEALVSVPQSERGGEIAQRGFDYQTCWALSQMLEYELGEKNYVFIFEYHDDVVIIDDEFYPADLIFAQVKTKEKHWTASSLSGSTKAKPISIIGKLFIHYKNFAEYAPKLLFVTNTTFNLCDENGGKSCFSANEVKDKYQAIFKAAVKDQVELEESSIDLSVMQFIQSPLSLDDHITHLKGKLYDFLSKKFGDNSNLNVNVLVSLLEHECREKSKVKSADIIDFPDLILRKGFSSKKLNNVLESLSINNHLKPDWSKANLLFSFINKTPLQLIALQAIFSQVCIDLNKCVKNPSTMYLEYVTSLYNEDDVNLDLRFYVNYVINKVDEYIPDHALTLTLGKKECIVLYSVIQKQIEGGE